MTIALGVLCRDGIVLGTDLEYMQEYASMPGQKMFWLPESLNANYFILIAAAGCIDSAKTFTDTLGESLTERFPTGVATLRDVKRTIRDSLKRVWFEHIYSTPEKERELMGFDLVVAIRVDFDYRLFRTFRTMLVEEKGSVCSGVGMYVGQVLTDLLFGWKCRPTVETASQVVAYIIKLAGSHIQYVGHGSDIHILPWSGLPYSFLWRERQVVEDCFDELFIALRDVIACVDSATTNEEDLTTRLGVLGRRIQQLRSAHIGRAERRSNRLAQTTNNRKDT